MADDPTPDVSQIGQSTPGVPPIVAYDFFFRVIKALLTNIGSGTSFQTAPDPNYLKWESGVYPHIGFYDGATDELHVQFIATVGSGRFVIDAPAGITFRSVLNSDDDTFWDALPDGMKLWGDAARILMDNIQVVGPQQGAIANAVASVDDNTRAINQILAAMRAHGLIDT